MLTLSLFDFSLRQACTLLLHIFSKLNFSVSNCRYGTPEPVFTYFLIVILWWFWRLVYVVLHLLFIHSAPGWHQIYGKLLHIFSYIFYWWRCCYYWCCYIYIPSISICLLCPSIFLFYWYILEHFRQVSVPHLFISSIWHHEIP